jgi:DNA-binding NtrC family response regulator
MPHSHLSILIIEDDSRVSRLIRDTLETAYPTIRVEIAGSASKAAMICQRFRPTWIIWDGVPNERGTAAEYAQCIPLEQWKKVIPISHEPEHLELAKTRGAQEAHPKQVDHLHAWADGLLARFKKLIPKKKR